MDSVSDARRATYRVCGIEISAMSPATAAASLVNAARERRAMQVHLCNAYTLSLVDSDPKLRSALLQSDLNLPDGAPVARLGKRKGTRGPVRGPGLVGDVATLGVTSELRHFLYGGKRGVAGLMSAGLEAHAPGIKVVGHETPPFRPVTDVELASLAQRIELSGADIVWIGVGTPNQDYLVPRLAQLLRSPVVPVGAAFDFWSGAVSEAPKWLHGSGFEWLHRLASEPRRLWRRYLIGNPRFVVSALRHARKEAKRE